MQELQGHMRVLQERMAALEKQAQRPRLPYWDLEPAASGMIPAWANVLVILLLCAVPVWVVYRLRGSLPYDDAFITFTYARNLAEGKGFVYNGGQPYLGTTTPLLTLLLAALRFLVPSVEVFSAAKWVGAALWAVGGVIGYRLARALVGGVAGIAVAALHVSGALYPFMLGSEYPLLITLCLLSIWCAYRGRQWLAGLALGLAFLARGDAAILAALIGVALLARERRIPWRLVIGFGAVVLPWSIYATVTFGSPLPATLAVKSAHRALKAWPHLFLGFWQWWRLTGAWFQAWTIAVSAFALLGLALSALARRVWVGFVMLWGLLYAATYVLLDVPFYFWYSTPLFSALAVEAGIGLGGLYVLLRGRRSPSTSATGGTSHVARFSWLQRIGMGGLRETAAALLLMIALGGVMWLGYQNIQRATSGLLRHSSREVAYVETGRWLAQNTPRESTVAFIEVGWVGYFSQRQILDLLGLTSPGTEKYLLARDHGGLFQALNPDFYIRNTEYDGWGMNIGVHQSPYFQTNYLPATEIPQPGQKPVVIYRRTRP
jgi:hypothetical protein